jgi:hypothetical protein
LPTTLAVAHLVKGLKGASSHLVTHALRPAAFFKWQGGYGAFAVSPDRVAQVRDYVQHQKRHHAAEHLRAEWERTSEGRRRRSPANEFAATTARSRPSDGSLQPAQLGFALLLPRFQPPSTGPRVPEPRRINSLQQLHAAALRRLPPACTGRLRAPVAAVSTAGHPPRAHRRLWLLGLRAPALLHLRAPRG